MYPNLCLNFKTSATYFQKSKEEEEEEEISHITPRKLTSSARNVQYWSFIFSIFSLSGKICRLEMVMKGWWIRYRQTKRTPKLTEEVLKGHLAIKLKCQHKSNKEEKYFQRKVTIVLVKSTKPVLEAIFIDSSKGQSSKLILGLLTL